MKKDKPKKPLASNQRIVNGPEYLEYCRRAKAGEFHIATVEIKGNGKYLLTLAAPIKDVPVPKGLAEKIYHERNRLPQPELTADEMFKEVFA